MENKIQNRQQVEEKEAKMDKGEKGNGEKATRRRRNLTM
jgi:hypothetical protein